MEKREKFASRLGFILISAGCAIGLGNVWRFPYITGKYGGGAFVLLYIVFLIALTLPIVVMEFGIGRASQKSYARAFEAIEPAGTKWHRIKWIGFIGCYILMMFYMVVSGWLLDYIVKSGSGVFSGLSTSQVADVFSGMLSNPLEMIFWTAVVVLIGALSTRAGLQKGVERITKVLMVALFVVLALLSIRSVTLPGASAGVAFYLIPDFARLTAGGLPGLLEVVYAAMGQAFFTMSVGIGALAIFGSYIDKSHALPGEALRIGALDTVVAFMAGLIIFPACAAFGVNPQGGPGLVFQTLPVVFESMPLGNVWGCLFFIFMSVAALSTVIAVFEFIMSFSMEQWNLSRKQAVLINSCALFVLAIPCALGFNVWSACTVPGIGNIQGIEDFIVSNNLLPLGSLAILVFCTHKRGWGWKNFLTEADEGQGIKFPRCTRVYISYIIPLLIVFILVMGYIPIVSKWISCIAS
jgi:hypothetical protein